jgi:hypothetical protein
MLNGLSCQRAALSATIAAAPDHLRPLFHAVRDEGCDVAWIFQGAPATRLPKTGRPLIAVVGDDLDRALGPEGFHRPTLRRLVREASVASIVSSGPVVDAYERPATNAVLLRENVIIVETRPEQELAWANFVRDARPEMGLLLCSVAGGYA